MRRLRVAVLASGRGSNFAALARAQATRTLPIELVGVFSDKPQAPVLALAFEAGVYACVVAPRDFADRAEADEATFSMVDRVQPDLIVCAGYMRVLGSPVVAPNSHRMINIHPSLLPRHRGLHTHRQALAAGDVEHGASLHFVTPELDGGPVFAQARVPVLPGDGEAALAARVLQREHPLLLAGVGLFAAGRLALGTRGPLLDGVPLDRPLQLDADDRLQVAA